MSRNARTRTFWYVRPTKTQISLCIREIWSEYSCPREETITKTRLFKYIENFTTQKNENFQIKILIFFMFLLKI